jgi:hemerythrin-like domain-containing protein
MMDEQQTQRINEAAKEFSDALGDSYQALTNRTVSTQEQVAQLTQAFFEGVIEHLRAQAQGNQEMLQELVDQQQQQQREATQALAQETSVEDYMRLLGYMCSYYRLLVASRSKRV